MFRTQRGMVWNPALYTAVMFGPMVKFGGSLTGGTRIENDRGRLVAPASCNNWTVTTALPNAFGADKYVSVPVGLIAGCTEKRFVGLVETTKVKAWDASSRAPGSMDVAQAATVCGPLSSRLMWLVGITKEGGSLMGMIVMSARAVRLVKAPSVT